MKTFDELIFHCLLHNLNFSMHWFWCWKVSICKWLDIICTYSFVNELEIPSVLDTIYKDLITYEKTNWNKRI